MVQGMSGMRPGPWRAARPWLLASVAAVAALAVAARPALAVDCDPAPAAGGTATCTAGSPPSPGSDIIYAPGVHMTLALDGTTDGPLTINSVAGAGARIGAVTLIPGSAAGPSQITTTGTVNINTFGQFRGGLFIDGSGVGADVGITVTSGTTITTANNAADGARAVTDGGGSATVTLTGGSISTTGGSGANGVFAGSADGAATVTITGGSIETQGLTAHGAYASSSGGGAATVTLTGGTIQTGANGANGAFAESAGGAAAVTVSSGITTLAGGAVGAVASGLTGATVTLTGGSIATTGDASHGGYANLHGTGLATVSIDAASTITTQGSAAHGAFALVDSGTGGALVTNAGSVETTGPGASGLFARTFGTGEARVEVTGGTIITHGDTLAGVLSGGAIAQSAGGAATVIVTGSITTHGFGIAAAAASGATGATVTLIGASIATTNQVSHGGYANLEGIGVATVSIDAASTITTQGGNAHGAYAEVTSGTGSGLVVNAGSVATTGTAARGLYASVLTGPAEIRNTGSIATAGSSALGIAVVANGAATIISSGSITTAGASAIGAFATSVLASSATASITVSGSVATAGANAHGIMVEASGTAMVTSSGSVTAAGAAASGIHITGAAGGYIIAVTGGTITGGSSFDASLGTGAGISIGGGASGTIEIAAGATVQAASGVAVQDGAGALALTSRGSILGSIAAGGGNDQVTLAAGSTTTGLADGGLGTDAITLAGARFTGSFTGWESLGITQGSHATLNTDIVMGDAATLTGAVTIDATSTLAAPGDRTIRAFDAASLVTVTNAGLIQIGSGGTAGNTLTIAGNYVGQSGVIALNTVLAGDGSASDRLVISGGRASGDTALRITNVGGAGAPTVQGIRVVETRNGGTTDAGAFRLNTRVTAGAFEYQLFRGGSGSAQDWYLRSFLIPETPVTPEEPGTPDQPGPVIPLYRPEVSLYAPVAAVARQMGLSTLATLRDRRGDEEGDDGAITAKASSPYASGAWARVIGERSRSRWDGTVDARAVGNLIGLQAGFDILQTQPYAGGHRDIAGVYVAYTDFNAPSVSGFALGQQNLRVGRLLVSGPAVGAYWTHFGPSGWYVDAVVQVNWFDVSARSDFGTGLSTSGTGYAASLEAGYPIRIAPGWRVEPSAQLVWQGVSVDRSRDAFSSVDWDEGDAVTGRIGARLQYTGRDDRTLWQPYAKLNLWHAFSGDDRVSFGSGDPIESRFGETTLEVGAGVTARVTEAASFYAHADYRWSVAGDSRQTAVQGSIGIRVTW